MVLTIRTQTQLNDLDQYRTTAGRGQLVIANGITRQPGKRETCTPCSFVSVSKELDIAPDMMCMKLLRAVHLVWTRGEIEKLQRNAKRISILCPGGHSCLLDRKY